MFNNLNKELYILLVFHLELPFKTINRYLEVVFYKTLLKLRF